MNVKPAAHLPLAIAAVLLIVGTTAGPALGSYYFSEDIVQYWLAWLSLTSHPELIGQHFTMPWFQCSNMGLFYRPLVDMAYITDTLIYGRNTVGFHLTNYSCHLISSVMCLLITRHLLIQARPEKSTNGATITGLVAGLLFGLNPLQLEPVYWLCCRCDALCTMLSLTALYLALAGKVSSKAGVRYALQALAVVAWLLALLAKEQAALLPFVLFAHELMLGRNSGLNKETSAERFEKIKHSLIQISPYLVLLAVYSALRLSILGGVGGYHGTIGALLNETLWDRISSPIAWSKLFYPMDEEAFADQPYCTILYSIAYCLMAVGCLDGWRSNTFDAVKFKLIKFFAMSALIVQVAAYQSFIITESLFGGRCVYMAEAFGCMALATIFMCFRPRRLRNLLIPTYLALLACTHVVNGDAWVKRGENLKQFQKAVNEWSAKAGPERRFCLLNMPLDARESSSLYDLEQMRCLLKPPVNSVDNAGRAVAPNYLRMSLDLVNNERIKTLLADPDVDFVISSVGLKTPWAQLDKTALQRHFAPIDESVPAVPFARPKEFARDNKTHAFEIVLKGVREPQRADFIEVTVTPDVPGITSTGKPPDKEQLEQSAKLKAGELVRALPMQRPPRQSSLTLLWFTDLVKLEPYLHWNTAPFYDDGREHTYVFSTGERLCWKYCGNVYRLLIPNLLNHYKITGVRLRDSSTCVPLLRAEQEPPKTAPAALPTLETEKLKTASPADDLQADGFYAVNDKQSAKVTFDAARVSGANSVIMQISEPDFMYSLHAGGYRDFEEGKHTSKTIKQDSLSGNVTLTRSDFPLIGKYQVRLFALDKNKVVAGFCSDPVDVMVTDRPLANAFEKAVINLRAQKQR